MTFDPFVPSVADYFSNQQIASGETDIPRLNAGSTAPLASTNMTLTYFTAQKTEQINNAICVAGGTAAGATPTYCAFGLYSVDASGNLTLLGQVANDTTLFASTFATYTRAITTPFLKQAGQRYAFGLLVISAATMPTIVGYNGTVELSNVAPRLCGQVTGQASMPASVAAGSVSGASSAYFGAVTP
jgi:hypothetical protein